MWNRGWQNGAQVLPLLVLTGKLGFSGFTSVSHQGETAKAFPPSLVFGLAWFHFGVAPKRNRLRPNQLYFLPSEAGAAPGLNQRGTHLALNARFSPGSTPASVSLFFFSPCSSSPLAPTIHHDRRRRSAVHQRSLFSHIATHPEPLFSFFFSPRSSTSR